MLFSPNESHTVGVTGKCVIGCNSVHVTDGKSSTPVSSRDCTWFRRSKGLHWGDRRLKVTRTKLGPSGIEEPVNALLSDESHSVGVTGK